MTGTDSGSPQASPPPQREGSFAYCAWCRHYSTSARLVRLQDQGSGPGAPGLYACTSCREAHDLVPLGGESL